MTASSQIPGPVPPLVPVPHPLLAAVDGARTAQAQPAATASNEINSYVAQVVEAIVEAPTEQARATLHAELEQAAEDRECLEWFHGRLLQTAPVYAGCAAVRRLCEGRPPTHHLSVAAILAALDGHAPAARPITLAWDGSVAPPAGDRPGEKTLIPLKTALDAEAVLELDDKQRAELGARLTANAHTVEACETPGCGMGAGAVVKAGPHALLGWILIDVAGASDGPRWWCSPACAGSAMAVAGAELAELDQAAATDPYQQAPGPLYGGDVGRFIGDAYDSLADQDAEAAVQDRAPADWPPNGGHDALCSYTGGIGPLCTCTDPRQQAPAVPYGVEGGDR